MSENSEQKFDHTKQTVGGGYLNTELGIVPDAITPWTVLGTLSIKANQEDAELLNDVLEIATKHNIPTYEEYIRNRYNPDQIEPLINGSSEAKRNLYNSLAAKFNSERERIAKEKDLEALKKYWQEITDILKKP